MEREEKKTNEKMVGERKITHFLISKTWCHKQWQI